MAGNKSAATPGEVLQRRVERFLAGDDPVPGGMPLEEVRGLVHELQLHQLELEAQNAALRRRQKHLEASHRNLAAWYDFTPVGYFSFDRQGLIVDVNLAGTVTLGAEKELLLSRPFCGFVTPELQGTFQAHLRQVFSGGGKQQCRLQLAPQGGAPFPVSLQSLTVRDQQGDYSLCRTVVNDISGRLAAEERLSGQLRFLQEMIDTVPYPIFFKDSNGLYQGCNRTFEAYFRVSREQIIGKTPYALASRKLADFCCQKDAELFCQPGAQIYESQLRRSDGSTRDIVVHKATYTNADGVVGGLLGVILDVTDARLAEAALRETHERLAALLESAPDPIFFKDAQGRYLVINQAGAESLGLRKEDCIGKTDVQLLPPEAVERFRRSDGELLQKRQPTLAEVYTTNVKDKKRIFQAVKFPLYDDQGRIRGIGCIARDITLRREAEQALARHAALIHDLYNNAPCGYHSLDREGIFVQINDTELTWLGYSRDEVLGRIKFSDLLSADTVKTFEKNFPDFVARGWVRDLEFDLIRRDGTVLPVLLSATAIKDDAGNYVMSRSTVFDLTFRRQVEESLRRSEANLQALFDTVQDFIWVVDKNGCILRVNHVVRERLGYGPDELLGRSVLAVHPAGRQAEAEAMFADLLTGKTDVCPLPLLTKDGREIPVETKVTRGRWFDQEALFGVSRDLTLRRTIEAQLIQSAKMASLGVMAGGIAHEIRTPLTVCSSAAQFLREDDLAPEFQRQCLEKMLSGITKASTIIENLLKFARAPENLEMTMMNLVAVIDDTLGLVANQARLQRTELRQRGRRRPFTLTGWPVCCPRPS